MRAAVVVLWIVAAGCGRLDFDPLATGTDPRLASLQLASTGVPLANAISPAFDPDTATYQVDVGLALQSVAVIAVPIDPATTITVAAMPVTSGAPSDAMPLELGQTTIAVVATAADGTTASYAITVTRAPAIAQQLYLKASNTNAGDAFGFAVSLSGDTLAVSALHEASAATGIDGDQLDNSATNSGAVYVFTRSGASWTQQAYLKASDTAASAFFGNAVALSADTLAVAAYGVNAETGAVYIFTRTGTTWTQQAELTASNAEPNDRFGASIALSGETLAVGALYEASAATGTDGDQADNSAPSAGAAYVFTRTGTAWTQQAYVKASNTIAGAQFGASLALAGDTLAIGAPFDASAATGIDGDQANMTAPSSGAVYVYTRTGTAWMQQAYVKASNTGVGDRFGQWVSIAGTTLAVGAPYEASAATGVDGDQANNSAPSAGAVYVFTRPGATWSQQAYLKASNTFSEANFGWDAALSDDTLAIASLGEASAATGVDGDQADNTAGGAGAVYVFSRLGAGWQQLAYLKASNTNAGDQFGTDLSLSGDTLVVGAEDESSAATGPDGNQADNSAVDSGAVYIFE